MIASAQQFVGQPLALRLLAGYLRKDRIAGTFLFTGERGLGKTTLATIFARAIVCERNKAGGHGGPPHQHSGRSHGELWFCGECYACRTIAAGEQPEYVVIRPHGKVISVEHMEHDTGGLNSASLYPTLLSHRIFQIEEAHQFNQYSGNTLLKLFEEPPAGTIFLLDTDKPELLLPTIRSRGNPIRLTALADDELRAEMQARHPGAAEADIEEAVLFGGGRFVETSFLVRGTEWRSAIKQLASAIEHRRGIPDAARRASEFGVQVLWRREVEARGIEEDEANALIRSTAAGKDGTPENQLKKRHNELERESLIASYSYALKYLVESDYRNPRLFHALGKLKQRINQNVDALLAQVAFENAL
jgi:DNA polymerase III delta prime subunit